MDMHVLMAKLEWIATETGEGQQTVGGVVKGGDEFKRLKSQIAAKLKDVRSKLKEREEVHGKGTNKAVQISHAIRQQLKAARSDADKLVVLQRKEAAKSRGKVKASGEVENRQEVLELVFKHIEECELHERKRFAKNSEARIELFSGAAREIALAPVKRGAGPSSVSDTELLDIESETQAGLLQLERKNVAIDQQLEVVAEGVSELRSIALNMRDEVKVQGAMVDEITHKVESASTHLNTINKKMKHTLAQTRSADRFILDFILLILLLAIVGYIISLVTR